MLACDDGNIRVMKDKELFYTHKLTSQPMTLFDGYLENVRKGESQHSLFYGTKNGEFGLIDAGRQKAVPIWSVKEN